MNGTKLVVELCSHKAAKYAVENWHYSRILPRSTKIPFGVWENEIFIGCVIFSRGSTDKLCVSYGIDKRHGCELTRVALTEHESHVSHILSSALKKLRHGNPNMRLVISFADQTKNHHGGIYQAGNWIYTGLSNTQPEFIVNGTQYHARSIFSKGWKQQESWLRENVDKQAKKITVPGKHRYLMPLDKPMRRMVIKHSKPYPSN